MLVIGIRSSSIGMKHEIVTSREIKSKENRKPTQKNVKLGGVNTCVLIF